MSSVCEGEEAFFDTTDHFVKETSDYDIWLREPQSVGERRANFLLKMGFAECSIRAKCEVDETEIIAESNNSIDDDSLLSERRRSNSEANCSIDYSDPDWLDNMSIELEEAMNDCSMKITQASVGESQAISKKKKKVLMSWWRSISQRMKKDHSPNVAKDSKLDSESGKTIWMRTELNRKKFMECSAIFAGQVLKAHDGLILTMKFSPDGQYLASGGEDGVVCIWQVSMVDAKTDKCCYGSADTDGKSTRAPIIVPNKIFHIKESPLQQLKGHSGNVLDLAWSTSNYLLSSSTDKTVRLWQVDSDKCLGVFHHSNYVTCVQFNPVDESHFITGCIDGKARIWGIRSKRVEEWTNVQEIVTAICYQPNGKGFVVGSLFGNCRFYESLDNELILNAERKTSENRISSIQFLNNDSQRMMITSSDSKIRILDGLEVVRKYKGLAKSGSQTSASFTSTGRHIVSVGEDSRVHIFNHNDLSLQTSKQAKSTRSCESFVSEGASLVLTWKDTVMGENCCAPPPRMWDSERFSIANWFAMDGSSKGSATWPEEKLPPSDLLSTEDFHYHHHHHQLQQKQSNGCGARMLYDTWGMVFVTANRDGSIRTFHNYGLPIRI